MIEPAWNLAVLGFEETARRVHRAIRGEPGRFMVYVDSGGGVRIHEVSTTRQAPHSDNCIVGTYTGRVPIEVIEGDMLEEVRQRSSRKSA